MKIDLGFTENVPASPCDVSPSSDKCEEKTFYPSFYLRSKEKIELPDGRFRFVCEGQVTSKTERVSKPKGDDDEPEESCSYDIEVYSIEPVSGSKKSDNMVSVGDAFRAGAEKKMKSKMEYKE